MASIVMARFLPCSLGVLCDQAQQHLLALGHGVPLGESLWERAIERSVHEPSVGRQPRHAAGGAVRSLG